MTCRIKEVELAELKKIRKEVGAVSDQSSVPKLGGPAPADGMRPQQCFLERMGLGGRFVQGVECAQF